MLPHRHTVLVVDDDADTLDALTTSLALGDVKAHAVSSGQEALGLLAGGLQPCLMFLDIRMPQLDGWEVWERLRHEPAITTIPVVFVSAEITDPERAAELGIAAWLRKPVGIHELYEMIARFCQHADAAKG